MPTTSKYQLTAYVEEDTREEVRRLAREEGLSISRVAGEIVVLGLKVRKEISKSRREAEQAAIERVIS